MGAVLPWVLAAGVAAALLLLLRPRPSVAVLIRDGKAIVERGTLPAALVKDLEDVCAGCGVRAGRIALYPRARGASLRFSRGIPSSCHQRIQLRSCRSFDSSAVFLKTASNNHFALSRL